MRLHGAQNPRGGGYSPAAARGGGDSPAAARGGGDSVMGVWSEDFVEIRKGKSAGEPAVVAVNCPDEIGLGCDICRVILEFGLCITRGDVSTDGRWCYVVLWVVPSSPSLEVQWVSLKERLMSLCPSCPIPFYFEEMPAMSQMYLLMLHSVDRKGLLHDVTQVLSQLDLLIHRVKVSTTPDGRVVDFFYISDGMEHLHTNQRQDDTCEKLYSILGESCISCELQLVESFRQGFSALPPEVADQLFRPEPSDSEAYSQHLSPDMAKLKEARITIDNSLSPVHSLLQVHCIDQKGLLYDILRTLKDCDIQIAYERFLSDNKGYREVDLFIQQTDGKKITDPEKQERLCSKLRLEMLHPLRVVIVNRGPDTELLVANPVELDGKGRPRVFYDVTLALKLLGICIFSAEIGRHITVERQWEVYRFLLEESRELPLANPRARGQIVDKVRRILMGRCACTA